MPPCLHPCNNSLGCGGSIIVNAARAQHYYNYNTSISAIMSLLEAAELNDVRLVRKYLSSQNINKENSARCTPLMVACLHGCLEVIECLLEYGADVNHFNSEGMSSLMKAVLQSEPTEKSIQVIKLLVASEADLELKNFDGYTALAIACEQGKLEFVKLLLENNAVVNFNGSHDKSPLPIAIHHEHTDIVEALLARGASIIFDNFDVLRFAVERGNSEIVKKLLLNCNDMVQLNHVEDDESWSYLMEASFQGHHKVAEVLLEYKADIDLKNKSGDFALKLAGYYGHIETVKLLLNKNADPNLKGQSGYTALMSTIESRICEHKKEIVELLINKGASISSESTSGMTALKLAISIQSSECVEILLREGAEVNHQCEYGWYPMQTPLMIACQFGTKKIVELLLENDADVNLRDISGGYALLYAIEQFEYEVSGLLLKHPQVNTNFVTNDGRSAAEILKDAYSNKIVSIAK